MFLPLVAAAVFSIAPCTYGRRPARCGSLAVPENRTTSGGRTISLHFVVLPARTKHPKEPVFAIAGGPGQAVIGLYERYLDDDPFLGSVYRDHDRDLVFLDQRGTGLSHPLNCPMYANDAARYRYLFPLDGIRRCRSDLAKTSDLGDYGSSAAADDLNDVRARLGYAKIVLSGGSYGTDESLVYLRRHEATVRAAILESVAPPWLLLPLPFPRGAQNALDDLVGSCASDATCSQNFPSFRQEFYALLAQATKGIPVTGGRLSFEVLADRLRQTMYDSYGASFLPFIIHRAASGDPGPLAKLVVALSRAFVESSADGMNLSVTCSESLPFISLAQARAAAAGTFMGDVRYRAQRAACDVWNVRPVRRSFLQPIRSRVPVLMVGGADDPATPPQFGAQEVRYLPNGRQVLVPHGGHDIGSPCVAGIERQFLKTYLVRTLSVGCLRASQRPPFATSLKGLDL
jgi:pimeloyl-ACP methyl ester carboxylesterase